MNTHAPFEELPESHENAVSAFLTAAEKEGEEEYTSSMRIVVGDFNCAIAPLSQEPINTTTSVVSPQYRDRALQGASAIDGCFYSILDGKGSPITSHQAEISHLNTQTGEVYKKEERPAIETSHLSELQKKEITDYHMIMAVDECYHQAKIIADSLTIFEYQSKLRKELKRDDILVRPARNINNESRIALLVDRQLFECFQLASDGQFRYEFRIDVDRVSGIDNCYIFVTQEKTAQLKKITDRIASNRQLVELSNNITLLEEKKTNATIVEAYKCLLQRLVQTPNIDLNTSPYSIIVEHFVNDSKLMLSVPTRTIREAIRELDIKLYGAPPLDRCIKIAIYAVLGALMGVATSMMSTTVLIAYCGGSFSAFLATGLGLGVFATGGIMVGAGVGSGVGFWAADRAQASYDAKRSQRKEVLEPIEKMFDPQERQALTQ